MGWRQQRKSWNSFYAFPGKGKMEGSKLYHWTSKSNKLKGRREMKMVHSSTVPSVHEKWHYSQLLELHRKTPRTGTYDNKNELPSCHLSMPPLTNGIRSVPVEKIWELIPMESLSKSYVILLHSLLNLFIAEVTNDQILSTLKRSLQWCSSANSMLLQVRFFPNSASKKQQKGDQDNYAAFGLQPRAHLPHWLKCHPHGKSLHWLRALSNGSLIACWTSIGANCLVWKLWTSCTVQNRCYAWNVCQHATRRHLNGFMP